MDCRRKAVGKGSKYEDGGFLSRRRRLIAFCELCCGRIKGSLSGIVTGVGAVRREVRCIVRFVSRDYKLGVRTCLDGILALSVVYLGRSERLGGLTLVVHKGSFCPTPVFSGKMSLLATGRDMG